MAIAGGIGVKITTAPEIPIHAWAFGEDQGRYVVTVGNSEGLVAAAAEAGVPIERIGTVGGPALTLPEAKPISVAALSDAHARWLPTFMESHEG